MQSPALWQQLQHTAQAVDRILKGASTTTVLAQVPPDWRPGIQAQTYHVLRHLGMAQALRVLLAPKAPKPAVQALLLTALALAQNDVSDAHPGKPLYDPHTLVNQTVEALKKQPGQRALAPFVNACLRRYLREQSSLHQQALQDPQARWNHPQWWITRLQREQGPRWEQVLAANNQAAPMTLRVNVRQGSRDAYLRQLQDAGIGAQPQGPYGVVLAQALPVGALPGFAQGRVSVQDGAAQWAAPLLVQQLLGGHASRVLDACAAPGGKTAHLLELCDAQVTALEVDPVRTEKIHHTLARLGLRAKVLTADAARPQDWWDGQAFDAILLDAPCTASGIVKRHPDVRWLRRESDVTQLAAQQARLLHALWPLLREGGHLLYCTCSVFHAEGQDQVAAFLAHNTQARLLPSPGHLMPTAASTVATVIDNQTDVHDGFYYALLQKRLA